MQLSPTCMWHPTETHSGESWREHACNPFSILNYPTIFCHIVTNIWQKPIQQLTTAIAQPIQITMTNDCRSWCGRDSFYQTADFLWCCSVWIIFKWIFEWKQFLFPLKRMPTSKPFKVTKKRFLIGSPISDTKGKQVVQRKRKQEAQVRAS